MAVNAATDPGLPGDVRGLMSGRRSGEDCIGGIGAGAGERTGACCCSSPDESPSSPCSPPSSSGSSSLQPRGCVVSMLLARAASATRFWCFNTVASSGMASLPPSPSPPSSTATSLNAAATSSSSSGTHSSAASASSSLRWNRCPASCRPSAPPSRGVSSSSRRSRVTTSPVMRDVAPSCDKTSRTTPPSVDVAGSQARNPGLLTRQRTTLVPSPLAEGDATGAAWTQGWATRVARASVGGT